MAFLITRHDPFHVHKLMGVIVLCNFVYRLWLLTTTGTFFPRHGSFELGCVLMHALLSWSSLLLPLPSKRNFHSPMIWPEFRIHSILFATRHTVCTIISLGDYWPRNVWYKTIWMGVLVLAPSSLAKYATKRLGDSEVRTTNGMPYPSWVSKEVQQRTKMLYARAQFGATATCIIPDATMAFASLYAIQAAPLLMTLVRKGKIDSAWYHRIYGFCLWLGYVAASARVYVTEDVKILQAVLVFMLFPLHGLRTKIRMPTWSVWTLYCLCVTVGSEFFALSPHIKQIVRLGSCSGAAILRYRLMCVF